MLQTTIAKEVTNVGIGLHKGSAIKIKFSPLGANSGVVFHRTDINKFYEANYKSVINTQMATVIGDKDGYISTIEHLMSAVSSYGIDNLLISIDANEAPVLDGSAAGFCAMLDEADIKQLDAKKQIFVVKKEIKVQEGDKFASLSPTNAPTYDFTINFKHPSINTQNYIYKANKQNFINEIASARTFGFLKDVEYLKSKGLALGGSLENAVVLDDNGILNPEGLRFSNEFVRHKILDAIGDLYMLGKATFANYKAYASSHDLNHKLTLELLNNPNSYELVTLSDDTNKDLLKAFTLNF
ncbi:UDP-3-O-acyl-N-acetylglucosamine deacetylase [Campylobacter sp. RM12642]|uniref:UDP-3-O-acyl-N-acetylglucosamine deacetylase n=1 Tax=Campylobacter sp. RM12642 TaxID=2735736 RepID=UPI00301451C2|nr:UDP-3-O-acyl-N-acetylglucosamine deacetylase [Campylobacter sp. RM12642]